MAHEMDAHKQYLYHCIDKDNPYMTADPARVFSLAVKCASVILSSCTVEYALVIT